MLNFVNNYLNKKKYQKYFKKGLNNFVSFMF